MILSFLAILSIAVFLKNDVVSQTTQMEHWYVGNQDVDFTTTSTGTYSYATTTLPATTGRDGATNGMYDIAGNLIFYVEDGTVFDKDGVNKVTLTYTGNQNTLEISIIPLAGTCLEYYVIYSTFAITGHNAYVAYAKVTIDKNNNIISISNPVAIGGYSDNQYVTDCGFAVSNTFNSQGDRFLYIVEGNNLNNIHYFGKVKRFTITNAGIINETNIMNGQNLEYTPLEVELSHDGSKLAWGSKFDAQKIYVVNLNNPNYPPTLYDAGGNFPHGVEFSPDNSRLFFTTLGQNIKYINFVNESIYEINLSALGISRQIELGPDGLIYCPSSYTECKSLDPASLAYGNKTIPANWGLPGITIGYLPDQIDGHNYYTDERIKICCAESFPYTDNGPGSSYITSNTWTPTNNPFDNTSNGNIYLKNGFNISTNTTITIEDMHIQFGPDAKIVVLPSGKLILDGTTFSGLIDCNTTWKGIEVEGQNLATQNPSSNQGVLEMTDKSKIISAEVGIHVGSEILPNKYYGGGIIRIEDAEFTNNGIDIWMRPYQLSYATSSGTIPQASYIRNSTFTADQNLPNIQNKLYNILLWGIHGLKIEGNTFENTAPSANVTDWGIGIMSCFSSYSIEHLCDPQVVGSCVIQRRNEFINLYYGVIAYEGITSQNLIKIHDNVFDNTYHSVFLSGAYNAEVTLNEIEVATPGFIMTPPHANLEPPYGIYLNGGRGFKIEENNIFRNTSNPVSNGTRGIIVYNTGAVNNEIYNNILTNLSISNQAQCFNSGTGNGEAELGLKYFCNNHQTPAQDIWVGGKSYCNSISFVGSIPRDGIAMHQLQPYPDLNNPGKTLHHAAANRFSDSHAGLPTSSTLDFDNSDASYISYIIDGISSNYRYIPVYSSNLHSVPWIDEVGIFCDSKLSSSGNGTYTELYAKLSASKIAYNSSKLILNIWKDGGIEDLGEEIETTDPWDAYVQFNELMSLSPYLSDEALKAMIENPVFTSLMVKLIMVANPQSAHSDLVMEAIYNRIPEMPQSYIDEILAGADGYSPLVQLEANAATDYHLVSMIREDLKRKYRGDNENALAKDNLIALVSEQANFYDKFELATVYFEYGQYTDMQNTIDAIETNFELNEDMQDDLNDFDDIMNIAKTIKQGNLYDGGLTLEQKQSLEAMLLGDRPYIAPMALALLKRDNYSYAYQESIYNMPEASSRKKNPDLINKKEENKNNFKIFPNPALNYVTLSYNCELNNLIYTVNDLQGRLIIKGELKTIEGINTNEILIDLGNFNPGSYQVIISTNGNIKWNEKLVIIK